LACLHDAFLGGRPGGSGSAAKAAGRLYRRPSVV
jgi:hypothetical protein